MRTIALAIMACLLGIALGSGPDTLWVRRLALDAGAYGYGIASRGNAIGAVGTVSENTWLVVRLNQAGDTIWTRMHDTASGGEEAFSTCLDAESNVLVAGNGFPPPEGARSPGALRLPGRSKTRNLLSPLQGQYFALTAKYDSLGELKWLRTDTNYAAFGITDDSAGNCYISGACFTSDTTCDFWLAKLDSVGRHDLVPDLRLRPTGDWRSGCT